MRKAFSIVGAALLAVSMFATPASAAGSASGSCGYSAGNYGENSLFPGPINPESGTVPAIFYQVNYSGVDAPTTLGVLIRYNGELESQVGLASATASNASGSLTGRFGAASLIDPEREGAGSGSQRGGPTSNRVKAWRGGTAGPGGNQSAHSTGNGAVSTRYNRVQAGNSGYAGLGGVTPGLYVFYVYTGEERDTAEGRRFFADEKNFLGRFSCAVEDNQK
ncbi:MAG TPA: hypothetical protein VEQ11_20250 [Chloroflexota bacterium]|nr:hypothetical protein [Chloroflexota bacterium]